MCPLAKIHVALHGACCFPTIVSVQVQKLPFRAYACCPHPSNRDGPALLLINDYNLLAEQESHSEQIIMATTVLSPSSTSSSEPSCLPSLLLLGSPIALRPQSPCALEAIPSFDWSDFPVVGSSLLDENDGELSYNSSRAAYQPQHIAAATPSSTVSSLSYHSFHSPIRTSFADAPTTRAFAPSSFHSVEIKQASSSVPSATSSCDSVGRLTPPVTSHKKLRRSVGFEPLVQVRTYAVTLGDHPYCLGGLALTCDWQVQHEARVSLESMETHRCHPNRSVHKKPNNLRLSYVQRRHRLVECTGLSPNELLQLEYEQDFMFRQREQELRSKCSPDYEDHYPHHKHVVYHCQHRQKPLHHTHPSVQRNLVLS